MRVRLRRPWATAEFNHAEGAVVDLDPAQARAVVDQAAAEALDPFPPEEAAEGDTPPAGPTPKRRGRRTTDGPATSPPDGTSVPTEPTASDISATPPAEEVVATPPAEEAAAASVEADPTPVTPAEGS